MNILRKIAEIEKKAENFGFAWSNSRQILDQIRSECEEIEEVIDQSNCSQQLQEEIGDLIEATLSLCLFNGFDLEETLALNLQKLEKRLNAVMRLANQAGYSDLKNQPFELLMKFWDQAKAEVG